MSHILNLFKKAQAESAAKISEITNNINTLLVKESTSNEPSSLANFLQTNNLKLLKHSVHSEILTTLIYAHEKNVKIDGVEKAEKAMIEYLIEPIKQKLGNLKLDSTNPIENLINEIRFNVHVQLQEMAYFKFMIYQINL